MSDSAQLAIAVVIRTAFGLAITCICYAVLSTFLWAWLAAVLAFIASLFIEQSAPVKVAEVLTYNAAVSGAGHAISFFRGLRAKVAA